MLFGIIFIGAACKKNESTTLKCNSIGEGGCFQDKGSFHKGDPPPFDTLFSKLAADSMAIGFHDNCCSEFNCSVSIIDDLIAVNILTTKVGDCNCLCYYTYTFKFTGSGEPRKYYIKVYFDDILRLDTFFSFPWYY
jgi:hypothetical protein